MAGEGGVRNRSVASASCSGRIRPPAPAASPDGCGERSEAIAPVTPAVAAGERQGVPAGRVAADTAREVVGASRIPALVDRKALSIFADRVEPARATAGFVRRLPDPAGLRVLPHLLRRGRGIQVGVRVDPCRQAPGPECGEKSAPANRRRKRPAAWRRFREVAGVDPARQRVPGVAATDREVLAPLRGRRGRGEAAAGAGWGAAFRPVSPRFAWSRLVGWESPRSPARPLPDRALRRSRSGRPESAAGGVLEARWRRTNRNASTTGTWG